MLGDDWGPTINGVMLRKGSYLEFLKQSKITGKNLPDFDDYLVSALADHVVEAMKRKEYAEAPPDLGDAICQNCHSQLKYSILGADKPLICRTCNELLERSCPVCGSPMNKEPPRLLKCPGCGYRVRFSKDLVREFASVEEVASELAAGRYFHTNS